METDLENYQVVISNVPDPTVEIITSLHDVESADTQQLSEPTTESTST